jgi:hypothetical protein
MNLKEIKGRLITENVTAVRNIDDRRAILQEFSKGQIRHLIRFKIGEGNIAFQIDHAQLVEGTHEEALSFIQSLNTVINSEIAEKFKFTGQFIVTIETEKETIAFLITIKDCKVSYQEIEYTWPEADQN